VSEDWMVRPPLHFIEMNGLSENESSVHPSIDGKRNIYSSKGSKNVGTPVVFKVCSRMPAAHASKTIMRESASASTIQLLHANEDSDAAALMTSESAVPALVCLSLSNARVGGYDI
jgi:hypothetical protein